jgi:hypothetical protein
VQSMKENQIFAEALAASAEGSPDEAESRDTF